MRGKNSTIQASRWLASAVLLGLVAVASGCAGPPGNATASPAGAAQATSSPSRTLPERSASSTPRPEPSPTPAPTPEPTVGTEVGQRAPEFSLSTTEGEIISLADLRGRPVWINFWSTTCPACTIEMPVMEAMYHEHRASDLEIVGIALATPEGDAVAFAEALGITYPLALDSLDVGESSAIDYGVIVLPTHFFIDRDGIVRGFVAGEAPLELFDEKVARIVEPTE